MGDDGPADQPASSFSAEISGKGEGSGTVVRFPSAAASFRILLRVSGSAGASARSEGWVYFFILIFPSLTATASTSLGFAVHASAGPLQR